MARWTGTWLSGLGAAGVRSGPQDRWRGERLGLPAAGAGSLAPTGVRLLGFALDLVAGALIGSLLDTVVTDPTRDQVNLAGTAAVGLEMMLLIALTGQSIGMRIVGLRVVRPPELSAPPAFLPAALRTALLLLLVPALISDRDGRGLHDKAAGTAVVRARAARPLAVTDAGSRPSGP